jgi:hypothetical protein
MPHRSRRFLPTLPTAALALCLCFLLSFGANAEENDAWHALPDTWAVERWTLQTSLYTTHFDPKPDHNNDQNLFGLEMGFEKNWVIGGAVFENSYGQNSQLVYMGKYWHLFGSRHWYGKLMAGFLHGYKEPYEDKIPLNGAGIAPVFIPALGFRYKWLVIEGNLGGLSAFTVTAGVSF